MIEKKFEGLFLTDEISDCQNSNYEITNVIEGEKILFLNSEYSWEIIKDYQFSNFNLPLFEEKKINYKIYDDFLEKMSKTNFINSTLYTCRGLCTFKGVIFSIPCPEYFGIICRKENKVGIFCYPDRCFRLSEKKVKNMKEKFYFFFDKQY